MIFPWWSSYTKVMFIYVDHDGVYSTCSQCRVAARASCCANVDRCTNIRVNIRIGPACKKHSNTITQFNALALICVLAETLV